MKLSLALQGLLAVTTLAAPFAEAEVEDDSVPSLMRRDGPSLTTYAVQGFRVSSIGATIKPWSLLPNTQQSVLSFSVQPLSPTYQNLGVPFTCTKTWSDSLLKGTASTVVKCSNPNASIYTSRNYLTASELSVYLSYNLAKSANSTAATQYSTKFTLNQNSVQLRCTKDKASVQNCVSSGTSLLTSTLSSKSVS